MLSLLLSSSVQLLDAMDHKDFMKQSYALFASMGYPVRILDTKIVNSIDFGSNEDLKKLIPQLLEEKNQTVDFGSNFTPPTRFQIPLITNTSNKNSIRVFYGFLVANRANKSIATRIYTLILDGSEIIDFYSSNSHEHTDKLTIAPTKENVGLYKQEHVEDLYTLWVDFMRKQNQ